LRPRLTMTRLEVSPADANEFWAECRRRVELMGGYRLMLTITESSETRECLLLDQSPLDDATDWELRYSKLADDGVHVTLAAWGQRHVGQSPQLDGIYRAFESACRRWFDQQDARSIPLRVSEPVPIETDRRAA
ncbi:MAG: hypothetical protein O3A00_09965, partial [Planctomycetota bacterium]|nr:hypothetical protein [Planctomycetota bacterium]